MDKRMIKKIQAEMAIVNAPGACECCPITLYENLYVRKLAGVGCKRHWIDLCERLGIKYSGVIDCIAFYNIFMGIKTCRFCRI